MRVLKPYRLPTWEPCVRAYVFVRCCCRSNRLPTPRSTRRTGGTGPAEPRSRRPHTNARADVLAYFDHHPSNGPTEAINGRLEALRRNALGFRNLTHYRIRSLLHCGNLTRQIDAL